MINDLCIVLFEFGFDHRCEGILNPSVKNFVAGGHDADFFAGKGQKLQNRLSAGRSHTGFFGSRHFFFFDHQRDNAGSGQLIPFFYSKSAVAGCDHHLPEAVDRLEARASDLEESAAGSSDLDLSLFCL